MAKILFINYGADGLSKSQTIPGSSRHQHVAREYHRQVKSKRATHQERRQAPSAILLPKPTAREAVIVNKPSVHALPPTIIIVDDDEDKADKLALIKTSRSLPSPFNLSGTRCSDPFDSTCRPNSNMFTQEMLDHAVTYMWSVFRLSSKQAGLDTVRQQVMQAAMSNPVAWHALLYGGTTHNAYRYAENVQTKNDGRIRLQHKQKALAYLLEDIKQTDGQVSDATLFGMGILAAHEDGEKLQGKKHQNPHQRFMSTAQDADYYSCIGTQWEHMHALYTIIDRRGGLHTIKMKSAEIAIQMYDIFVSLIRMTPVHFPLVVPTSVAISLREHKQDAIASKLILTLTSGFDDLADQNDNILGLMQILKFAAIIIADFDQVLRMEHIYAPNSSMKPDDVLVRYIRFLIIHDLVSLPVIDLSNNPVAPHELIYEAGRLILHAISIFVLLPVPVENTPLFAVLAKKFLQALELGSTNGPNSLYRLHPELFMCLVICAGMCAQCIADPEEQDLAVQQVLPFLCYIPVRVREHAWPVVSSVMKTFLWLDGDCELPGKNFWTFACRTEIEIYSAISSVP